LTYLLVVGGVRKNFGVAAKNAFGINVAAERKSMEFRL
jgi:hypothetical protein